MSDKLYIPIYVRPENPRYDRTKEFRNCPIRILPEDRQPGEVFKPIEHDCIANVMEKRYYCSNYGRIWDSNRQTYLPYSYNKPYNPDGTNDGYHKTKVAYHKDLTNIGSKDVYVHRAVGYVHIDCDNKDKLEINHIDGNHTNNNATNLEFVTSKENMNHAFRIGLCKQGVENEYSYIRDKDTFDKIVAELQAGTQSVVDIGKRYNISPKILNNIKTKKSYKSLTKDIDFNVRERSKPISDDKVTAICEQIQTKEYTGKTYQQIADEVGVSRDVVRDIGLGRNYKHITSRYNFGK